MVLFAVLMLTAACSAGMLRCYVPPGGVEYAAAGRVQVHTSLPGDFFGSPEVLTGFVEADVEAVELRLGAAVPDGLEVVISDDFETDPGPLAVELGRHVDGFYNHSRNIVFVEYRSDMKSMRATLRHELAHAVVAQRFPSLPIWLSEGVATTCEDVDDAPLQWARLLKFAARLRDRGPITLEDVSKSSIEDYSDYNDAWASFYVLERHESCTPLELLERWTAGEVDKDDAEAAFRDFQTSLRGKDGYRLEAVLGAIRARDELQPDDAFAILRALGQPRTQPVLALSDTGTVLFLHERAQHAAGYHTDRRWTQRILRQAVQPVLDPVVLDELGRHPNPDQPASVRLGLRRLAAAEDLYRELVDRLVPRARDLGIDLRPRELTARHVDLAVWVREYPSYFERWLTEGEAGLLPAGWGVDGLGAELRD